MLDRLLHRGHVLSAARVAVRLGSEGEQLGKLVQMPSSFRQLVREALRNEPVNWVNSAQILAPTCPKL